MNLKIKVIAILWVTGVSSLLILGVLDASDGILSWSPYVWLCLGIGMVILSGTIEWFTYSCPSCGILAYISDNYCRRCGRILLRAEEVMIVEQQSESAEKRGNNNLPTIVVPS
jgi:hypothetical protein